MPQVSGDRFSSQNMSDCQFCPPENRRFRTARQCSKCSRPLCLVCRPHVPQADYLCPECGGGAVEDAIHAPEAAIERISAAGHPVPYWLCILRERMAVAPARAVDELIVPE